MGLAVIFSPGWGFRMAASSWATRSYYVLPALLTALFFCTLSANGQKLPDECSLSRTNKSCTLIVDRANPLSPPTVQMYSGEVLTVLVKNANTFERYFLDFQSGQATLKPDVASSIVQGLLPSLMKVGEIKSNAVFPSGAPPPDVCANIAAMPGLKPGEGTALESVVEICVGQLAAHAVDIYRKLEPLVAPDSLVPVNPEKPEDCTLKNCISAFLKSEDAFSA